MATKFLGLYKVNGLNFEDNRDAFLKHCKFNIGKRFIIQDLEPESSDQRGFYHGAVIPLWVWLDGYNHRDSVKNLQYHEYAKEEFNPEILIIGGKQRKVGASTKNKLKGENGIINKVIDFLEEQYGIDRNEVLNPAQYKHWKDAIYPYEGADNYIDYLVSIKKLIKK